jgi:hypothetical protein
MNTVIEIAKWVCTCLVLIYGLGHLVVQLVYLYDKVMTHVVAWFKMNKLFIEFIRERQNKENERKARK